MNIPKKLRLGGHQLTVRRVRSSEVKGAGSYDHWYQCIKVNSDDTSEDKQAEAFLHEIIEAVNTTYDLDFKHKQLVVLSEVLFSVLRGNKLDFGTP